MITLSENVVGIWFLGFGTVDLLFHMERAGEDFRLAYRFRYYVDDKTHNSEDVKNWYEALITEGTEEQAIEGVRQTIAMATSKREPEEAYELLMGDKTMDEFMEEFMALPFVHGKTMDREEAEAEFPELRRH